MENDTEKINIKIFLEEIRKKKVSKLVICMLVI